MSHGCNRMEGEHVVEMAHILGLNLKKDYEPNASRVLPVNLEVVPGLDYWRDKPIEVAYAKSPGEYPPPPDAIVFPTWDARKLPQFVCSAVGNGPFGEKVCPQKDNLLDPITGGKGPAARPCPPTWVWEKVGKGGLCVNKRSGDALGPFPRAMQKECHDRGGGLACYNSDQWKASFAKSLYGTELCPRGAQLDWFTGYCVEGPDAFGPFPANLVQKCLADGNSTATCEGGRWDRSYLEWVLKSTKK